ncbi:MAG: hypothetical protein J5I52_06685 [Saprospiraceae bacterium]|nr:hypothetical protein [Saprospiraceae bacterium]MCZ2337314.1 hypothetical protein [Chitinophagales bacterium]
MNEIHPRFTQLLEAIEAERKQEEAFYYDLHVSKSLQDKRASGFVWYPIKITKKFYTVGENIEIVVERNDLSVDIDHKFSVGMAAVLFNLNYAIEFKFRI